MRRFVSRGRQLQGSENRRQETEVQEARVTATLCKGCPIFHAPPAARPQFAHSYRKAAIGSMDEARCAGTRHAADAAAISSNMTPSRISGSRDAPGDHFAMTLFRIRLKITPATKPPPTLTVADLNASWSTACRPAPSA